MATALPDPGVIARRRAKFHVLTDEHGDGGGRQYDVHEPPRRYVLIEHYPTNGRVWLTDHDTPEDAARYSEGNEDPGWHPDKLIDLDTGDRFVGHVTVEWKPDRE